jgi:Putative binding domain, N-terminal/Viral BACON domain
MGSIRHPGFVRTSLSLLFLLALAASVVADPAISTTCPAAISPVTAFFSVNGGTGTVTVTASTTCSWTATASSDFVVITTGSSGTGNGTIRYSVAAEAHIDPPSPPPTRLAGITIGDATHFIWQGNFCPVSVSSTAVTLSGAGGSGSVDVVDGGAPCSWSASSNAPWLVITSGSSGAEGRTVTFAAAPNLGGVTRTATIFVAGSAASGLSIGDAVTVTQLPLAPAPPVGLVETPLDDVSGISGSIAVTGWAIDDVGIAAVRIYRDPVAPEPPGQPVFIGTATRVAGARPDVAAAFPDHPENTRAGWGYLMLTNGLPNEGNGTFRIHAVADDLDGHSTLLGSRTITCDNAHATTPFGTIDTPAQGETVSGTVTNFGWVLSPGAARADPPHGGTVNVLVDGVNLGTPVAWAARSDLTAMFPVARYSGVANALGIFAFDATMLSDGLHTIAWTVTDSVGASAGVGSRYFTVANGTGLRSAAMASLPPPVSVAADDTTATPAGTVRVRRGMRLDAPLQTLSPDASGAIAIAAEELDRLELHLPAGTLTGSLRTPAGLAPLPAGSHWDPASAIFTWHPGVAFVGPYDVEFTGGGAPLAVRIVLHPRGTLSRTRVVIDTPATAATIARAFTIGGWAVDPSAATGSGIDAIHVWAYPFGGAAPIFLGAATIGAARPDVAAIYGSGFIGAGYALAVKGLDPGAYTLAVFAHRARTGTFVPAATTTVSVAR